MEIWKLSHPADSSVDPVGSHETSLRAWPRNHN
jgi:hypothetical protein